MGQVRAALGDDAVIVSTLPGPDGVQITAAHRDVEGTGERPPPPDTSDHALLDALRAALDDHGVPNNLARSLARVAGDAEARTPTQALAVALDAAFMFAPLPVTGARHPIMLVGPHGAGKTIMIAKLAARAAMADHPLAVISADNYRAGGIEQLSVLTDLLRLRLRVAGSPEALHDMVRAHHSDTLVLIDTAGVNPFSAADMDDIAGLVEAIEAAPVLVIAASGDAAGDADVAAAFHDLGARRLLLTRVDASLRLGGALTAAVAGPLALTDFSSGPHIATAFDPMSAVTLARLLLRDPRRRQTRLPDHED